MLNSVDTYRQVLDSIGEGVYVTDTERTIRYWNPAAEQIAGYPSSEVVGTRCSDNLLVHTDSDGKCLCTGDCPLSRTIADGKPRTADVFLRHHAGHRVPVKVGIRALRSTDGDIIGAVETFHDISAKVSALDQVKELRNLVYLDPLTGIANRRFLMETVLSRAEEQQRFGWTFGAIMMDVDLFKNVNDEYGHLVGDSVLQMVARTLRAATRGFDLVGRWGGEEFLAIIANADPEILRAISERYRSLVETSHLIWNGDEIRVTISAGAALIKPGEQASVLIDRADQMLYQAKSLGRNRSCVYERAGIDGSLAESLA
jgi:diguanylate cyclase (GGDEF)-like protein/PAS domain S-box-containing protein